MTYASYPYGAVPFGGLTDAQPLTIEERIEKTLFAYADVIATEADPPKVFPNDNFTPTALYLRIEQAPNHNERLFMRGIDPHFRQGILLIAVVSPLNVSSSPATKIAGQVAENFPADLALYNYGIKLRIQEAPYVGRAFPDVAAWIVPVSIRYQVFA